MNKFTVALITSLVNIFEWYDYALFGLFAQTIGNQFFPSSDHTASLLNAFLVFAVGYVIRPIGGIFFGALGDKFGRKVVLSSSVICMSIPTFIVGILPNYQTIGISSAIIMLAIRLLQGLAIGGALTGSVSFIVEHAPKQHKGLAASLPMAGICLGILLGSGVSYLTSSFLTSEQFAQWGWRIPFLLAGFIMPVGFYIRKYASETPEFSSNKQAGHIETSPIKTVFNNHKGNILISIFLNAAGSVLFYFQVIYISNYYKQERYFDHQSVDMLVNCSYVLMAIVALLGGYLSDRIGRLMAFGMVLLLIVILIFPMTKYLMIGNWQQVIIAHIVLSSLAALYIGAEPAMQCEIYPSSIRNTALSIAYNIATSIFGGTAPFVMQILASSSLRSLYPCSFYIILCSFFGLLSLKSLVNRRSKFKLEVLR
jgi:MHS family proline/betaine transporter-like MFS transporter